MPPPRVAAAPAPEAAPAGVGLGEFFDKYDAAQLSLSPETKARRGIRDGDYGKWDDVSDETAVTNHKLQQATAAAMRGSYDPAKLTPDEALSFELFNTQAARAERLFAFRDHGYIFDQMNGAQSQMPAFLINIHRVADVAEAEAYIERIRGLGPVARRAVGAVGGARGKGHPAAESGSMLTSSPTSAICRGADNAVVEDITAKVGKLSIDATEKARLIASAKAAWNERRSRLLAACSPK